MPKRVLYGVLDWGLGHATRSVPVIQQVLAAGCDVRIASSGLALELLRGEFPGLVVYKLPPYDVRYARHGMFMLNIIWQVPRLLITIIREGRAAENLASSFPADLVISDCRYGFRLRGRKSAFITHQIHFQMPNALRLLQPVVNFVNRALISRFDEVWIPDVPNGLTAKLSRPGKLAPKARWIGNLSRMVRLPVASSPEYEVALVLSGPEPQRTLFEIEAVHQLKKLHIRAVVVRGLPAAPAFRQVEKLDIYNYLAGQALADVIRRSRVVVARSGYSTVMDLVAAGGYAIFVPTPGQTEQELLAETLAARLVAFTMPQRKLDLALALSQSYAFRGFADWKPQPNLLAQVILSFIHDPRP